MTGYRSFGLTCAATMRVHDADEAIALLRSGKAAKGQLLAYGNGRSYGDSCLNGPGGLIDMRKKNRILAFDPASGLIEAEAGTLLVDIIAHGAPYGFFPPVVPGTQFVTLGGAIANDVHGKNHHRRGSFGCHVEAIDLLGSDGRVQRLERTSNAPLMAATIGGMGLTGLILSAVLRLMRVPSLDIDERVVRFDCLEAYFDLAQEADGANEYAVAWIDQLARGRRAGRGLLITGNHAEHGMSRAHRVAKRLTVPFQPPVNLLHPMALRAFNAAYRWRKGRGGTTRNVDYQEFFFPLDGIANWNRLYGPSGLYQHQSVVPEEAARAVLPALLDAARASGQGSFLTVLKRFGKIASPGLMSFARPGYTLTLDFPNRGPMTRELMDRLDRLTVEAGGAVNPYKDARMSEHVFAASFPHWRRVEACRDQAFISDFWRRTALRLTSPDKPCKTGLAGTRVDVTASQVRTGGAQGPAAPVLAGARMVKQ